MPTWCGQPDELALHWTPENCQRLGNVLWLLKTGKASDREKAFQEFLDLKRMFILEEFEEYLHRSDDFRTQLGQPTLSELIEQVKVERCPATNWKALAGPVIEPAMLPEMETVTSAVNELKHREYASGSEMEQRRIAAGNMLDYLNKAGKVALEILTTDYYSLFIKIIRRCK